MVELFVSGAALLCFDQWSKRMIAIHVGDRSIAVAPSLRLRCVASARRRYRRDSFRVALVLVWFMALASALTLLQSGTAFQSRMAVVAIGAAIGGAAGNLIDILRDGAVSDFIDFSWWPAFNIADTAIIGGLIVAFLSQ